MARTATSIAVCVAPEFSDEKLAEYSSLMASEPDLEIRECLNKLLMLAKQWWNLPESTKAELKDHPTGRIKVMDLDDEIKDKLYDAIPWTREIVSMGQLFDKLTDKPRRDCAYHLLWLARELDLDREPLTLDKLEAK